MTFMMTSSNDDKSDICQFFYQDLFHIVNTVYLQDIWDFRKSLAQVGLRLKCGQPCVIFPSYFEQWNLT